MTILSIFKKSEFSIAAYANLNEGTPVPANLIQEGDGLSDSQAIDFASSYSIITQYNDSPEESGIDTSFSTTIFKDNAGNLTIGFRGTLEFIQDIDDGKDIYFHGVAYEQIVAMHNWWKRVATQPGETVQQFAIQYFHDEAPVPDDAVFLYEKEEVILDVGYDASTIRYYLVETDNAVATGDINSVLTTDPNQKVSLTGHSLGGHLAMAFGALFPEVTENITVFNAPSFKQTAINEAFFSRMGGELPSGDNTVNIAADEALLDEDPFVPIAGMHGRPGENIDIAIEDQFLSDEPDPFGSYNHSIQALTYSLAVYATLSLAAPDLSLDTYKTLLHSSAIGTAAGLENLIGKFGRLFDPDLEIPEAGNDYRDALYQTVYSIHNHADYQAAEGKVDVVSLAGMRRDALVTQAKTDIAYRYALVNLDPFTLIGNKSNSVRWCEIELCRVAS
ncbi:hypothetical protein [Thiohalophilus sp.]|uniref:hypothetical protein n=1 Tax=Thiohalophilus sp. TaxID=3028392 RepID=UPI002ACE6789|nr:hypothetical protein [Thiohalophilus sp.]MDZ7805101.1 hypothetical protein [Thiohalophilus sp.]